MNKKQKAFCDRYVANGLNAREAYFFAYGSDKCADPTYPYYLLRQPEIKAYIEDERDKAINAMAIDSKRVMEELGKIAFGLSEEKVSANTRLRALEILSKNLNIQSNKDEVNQTIEVNILGD